MNHDQAYQQLPLHDDSKRPLAINAHKSSLVFNHLPFRVTLAPGIFKHIMDNLLQDIPNVVVYLDDILIASRTSGKHCQMLAEVLAKLSKAGF